MSHVILRPAVRWFAEQMELQLRANDHKGRNGWKDSTERWLLHRLEEETLELRDALRFACNDCGHIASNKAPQPAEIIKEAADVANFAMFIADNAKECR